MSNQTKKEYLTEHLDYCLDLATHKCKIGQYDHAMGYLRNATESINQMKSIENARLQLEEAHLALKQIQGDNQMEEWLSSRLMKPYD